MLDPGFELVQAAPRRAQPALDELEGAGIEEAIHHHRLLLRYLRVEEAPLAGAVELLKLPETGGLSLLRRQLQMVSVTDQIAEERLVQVIAQAAQQTEGRVGGANPPAGDPLDELAELEQLQLGLEVQAAQPL